MNRRERRQTEKYLGLTKHYQSLSRKEKFELMAERITMGKQRHTENLEKFSKSIEEQEDSKLTSQVSNLAELIAKSKNIPITEALEEARKEVESYKK